MGGIAIIGSCVTRDVWHLLELPTRGLTTISRTSIASLTSPIPAGFSMPETMGALDAGGFLARCVCADVEKTALATLESLRPSVLMFDFIDERFDLLQAGGGIVCDSFEFRRSGLRGRAPFLGGRTIRRLSLEADAIWHEGLTRLRARIEAGPLAEAKLVLHVAYWAQHYRQDGQIKSFPERARFHPVPRVPESVAEHNAMLGRYHQAFAASFPAAIVVAPPDHVRVGDASHPWGTSPHHYITDYYQAFRDLCLAQGITL